MKKHIVVLLCLVVLLGISGVTAYAVITIQEKQSEISKTGEVEHIKDFRVFISENAKGADAGPLDIPVYTENDILRNNDNCFFIGRDYGLYHGMNARSDYFDRIETIFPSKAIRESTDGSYIYVMYDMDSKQRMYLFFSKNKNGYRTLDGFIVLMWKKLSFNDFSGIKIGDSMELVEKIDPVIKYYKQVFDAGNDIAIENYTKMGAPPTSVHLLTDGILKIEYDRVDGNYVITNIVYNKDFVLDGLDGKTCYKITDADYVDNTKKE